jgi:hypothetical protein
VFAGSPSGVDTLVKVDTRITGAAPIGSVTKADVQKLIKSWSGRYAPRTVAPMYAVLRGVLSHAADCELIGSNPCQTVKLPAAAEVRRPILNAGELDRLAEPFGPDQAA